MEISQVINAVNSMKYKRIVLVGKAASGKDYARKVLELLGYKYEVSYTTRPPRTGEQDGKDYFFISEEEFMYMIREDEFYEWVPFNGWYYGTSRKQMQSDKSVFIMTPSGLAHMSKEDRAESFVVYFDIDIDIRRQRLSERSDADTVDRRIEADERDFSDFVNYDYVITNPNFTY
jgi:guanylate kinase